MTKRSLAVPGILAVLALLLVLLAGCVGQSGPPGWETPIPTTVAPVTVATAATAPSSSAAESVADANNRFALDLYSRLADGNDDNIFFSPFSLSSALAITSEGAGGTTADEIRSVFHFPENRTLMRKEFAGTINGVNRNSSAYTLRTANALWAEETFPFLPAYISTAEQFYGAKTTNLDFINQSDESRMIINRFVENQTANRIRDLLPAGSIDPLTRLVITNAIYFKGTWVKQFDRNETRESDFRTGTGGSVRVAMMQRKDDGAIYNETDTLQVLAMPYESGNGTNLSMFVLLPKNGDLDSVGKSLDPVNLSRLQQNLTPRRVTVYFPKFSLETKYSLPRVLAAMGMPTAFTDAADFSGMDGRRDLFINDVIHQAYIDVNEEGTEAAAATGVTVGLMSAPLPPPVFRADHPFIFLIQDNDTGIILFMGRVENPAIPSSQV